MLQKEMFQLQGHLSNFRFSANAYFSPSFQFEPGNDDVHYCKPTSVAVADDGKTFFVADGYCNSRVVKYDLQIEKGTEKHKATKAWQIGEGSGISIKRSVI